MMRFVGACLVDFSKKVARKKTKQLMWAMKRQKGRLGCKVYNIITHLVASCGFVHLGYQVAKMQALKIYQR